MKELIKEIAKNRFIIVDNASKREILKIRNQHPRLNFKIFTPEQVVSMFLGQKTEHLFLALINNYKLDYEYARLVHDNLIFADKTNFSRKTNQLGEWRTRLLSEGFINIDPLANDTFKGQDVLLLSHLRHHRQLINLLRKAGANITFTPKSAEISRNVVLFSTGNEEIYFVLNEIARLLDMGVKADKIKLVINNEGYLDLFKRLCSTFNLLLEPENYPLLSYPEVQSLLLSFTNDDQAFHACFAVIDNFNSPALINLYNEYQKIDFNAVKSVNHLFYFQDLLAHKSFTNRTNNGIEVLSALPFVSESDIHYFVPNFAHSTYPRLAHLSPFLTNEERKRLGLLITEDLSLLYETQLVNSLQNLTHVHLTFAPKFNGENFVLSSLVKKLSYGVNKGALPAEIYSQTYLNFVSGLLMDDYKHYDQVNELLPYLVANNPDIGDYNAFDFTFSGIVYNHGPLNLSYSALDLYQNLPFDYFARYLLGLYDDRPSFNAMYGTFVHAVFENSKDLASFEHSFYYYLDQLDFSVKDKFFVVNNYDAVKAGFINFLDYIQTTNPFARHDEVKTTIHFNNDLSLNGRFDRLLLFEKDNSKVAVIIDFKTGSATSSPAKYALGLDLQLPIYGLLLHYSPEFRDYLPGALVLNSITTPKNTLANENLFAKEISKSLKFVGIVVHDEKRLPIIDPTYEASDFFRGLKRNKGDKVLKGVTTLEEYAQYMKLAEEKVLETYAGIKKNDFRVAVKQIDKNTTSGMFTKFREISYLPSFRGDYEDDKDVNDATD